MLKIDIFADVAYRKVNVSSLTKTGKIHCDDGEVINGPAKQIKSIISHYKAAKFATPVPMALFFLRGELFDVEIYPYTSDLFLQVIDGPADEPKTFQYEQDWNPNLHFRIRDLHKIAIQHPEREWYCDGRYVYTLNEASERSLCETGKFTRLICTGFSLQDMKSINTNQVAKDLQAIRYTTGSGQAATVLVGNNATMENAENYLDNPANKEGRGFHEIDNVVTPSLGFLVRSVITWTGIFDDTVVENLPIPELLMHFRTVNLLEVPWEVRESCPTGVSYRNMLAWSMSLANSAPTFLAAAELQNVVESLLKSGWVRRDSLDTKNIYHKGKEGARPEKLNTEGTLTQIRDNRRALTGS